MNLRRGDIAYVAVKGPYTTKPRPVLVAQETATLELMESVTVCPITSIEVDAGFVRVDLSVPGHMALHELAILPLPGPGLTAHNGAYVVPRVAIGRNSVPVRNKPGDAGAQV